MIRRIGMTAYPTRDGSIRTIAATASGERDQISGRTPDGVIDDAVAGLRIYVLLGEAGHLAVDDDDRKWQPPEGQALDDLPPAIRLSP